MPIEAALIKPIVDAILAIFKGGKSQIDRTKAHEAIQEALKELWKVEPEIEMVEAAIRGAEIAGLIDADVQRAKNRLARVKPAPKPAPKAKPSRHWAPARKAAKKAPAKKAPAKKAPAKKAARRAR
jgi:hypothetical protein